MKRLNVLTTAFDETRRLIPLDEVTTLRTMDEMEHLAAFIAAAIILAALR